MRASDYAALREMLGYPAVTVEPGQYLIHCQSYVVAALRDWNAPVTVGGYTLAPGGIHTEVFAQELWNVNGSGFVLVVPDEVVQGCAVHHRMYTALTKEPIREEQYEKVSDVVERGSFFCYVRSREEAASMIAMTVFPLYYLALILTMTAATILTIRQLSETDRYRRQFRLLYKLGMDRREMEAALRKQLAIYYIMPAVPPILIGVPFIVHLGEAVEPGIMTGYRHPLVLAGFALGLFVLIYGIYILVAHVGLKRNVMPDKTV